MEITQRLQPVQEEACAVFDEIEGQGSQLYQVVATVEQGKSCQKEPPHAGHRVHGGPCREMCGGDENELGE